MTKSAGPALHDLYEEFGDRVEFLALYVREAHPGDHYRQPEQEATKLAQARAYAVRDNVPWPVAVDDIAGTLHQRLDPKPHSAYVVNRDGEVVFRTLWANHTRILRRVLAAVAQGDETPVGEDESKAVAMVRGLGSLWETLSVAGPVALRDVAVQAPPMWLTGRIASLFRPLPPLGRGLAAGAVLGGAGAAAGVAWRNFRRR
jgi:hypothetical protein